MPIGTDRNIMGESSLPLAAVMPALGSQEAVANMQKMMQAGFITADDIAQRASARESMKADLEIRAMQEAKAMAPKLAELKKQQTEEALAEQKYGPGIKLFQALAPVAGVSEIPKLPDGSVDYATMAEQGGKMAAWAAERQKATEEITPVPGLSGERTDPNTYGVTKVFVNKFGRELTPEYQQSLNTKATRSFKEYLGTMEPGTASTPKPAPGAVGAMTPDAGAVPTAAIQPSPTGGISLGVNAQAKMQAENAAANRAKTVSETQQAINNAKEMSGNIAEGLNIVSQPGAPVGALPGSEVGQAFFKLKAMLGAGEKSYSEQDKLRGLIGKKVLEGAQQMKGNLSDKDIRFLVASYPSLGSTRERWVSYLQTWKSMNDANQQVLAGLLPKGASVLSPQQVPADSEPVDAVVNRSVPAPAAAAAVGAPGSSQNNPLPWQPGQAVPPEVKWVKLPDGRIAQRP